MTERTRLRISVAGREFEVEGSEQFVREFVPRIESLLEYLGDLAAAPPEPVQAPPSAAGGGNGTSATYESSAGGTVGSFGEFMLRLPSSATDVDRMLAAGFFVQQGAPDDAFGTADANKKLTEQGIKLGNPSQCVKQSLIAKRVFMVQRGRYRVSQHGRAHLRQLLGGGLVSE
jgi:hypothetical protein